MKFYHLFIIIVFFPIIVVMVSIDKLEYANEKRIMDKNERFIRQNELHQMQLKMLQERINKQK